MLMKLEELENKVFTLNSENQAYQKTIDAIENELVKAKEKEEIYHLDLKEKSKAIKNYKAEIRRLQLEMTQASNELDVLTQQAEHHEHFK